MPEVQPLSIVFASEKAANGLVAGIPAAARALRALDTTEQPVMIAVPGGWAPSGLCVAEAQRIAHEAQWIAGDVAETDGEAWIAGDTLLVPGADDGAVHVVQDAAPSELVPHTGLQAYSRAIIKRTGKDGDGIVSRHINRPISQAITGLVLRWPGARPWHATFAAGLIGLAMFVALIFGGEQGLIAGAILFQLASIVDGVDGEMARATFRTSSGGALADSVTDALTNLSFIGGVSYNVFAQGDQAAGMAGALGFVILALGSGLLAMESRRQGGPFTFDAVKTRFRERPSRLKQWLIYITMRDFYAFAAFLAIMLGAASELLFLFAGVATGWFLVVCVTLIRSKLGAGR